ncbi:MAG: ATP-binding protein [Burkholderiaceae bacterium]|nr:ATP-binding protein [Burkholderiaceae bacterium]
MNKKLLALYGLKWNPFAPELPTEALRLIPAVANFAWRIEHSLVREGGFALLTGDAGTGKSVALRLLAERLAPLPDLSVAALAHPSANLADFYRELGDLFSVELKPHNRWMGFKALRSRWLAHLDSTLLRPVLLIDEAQQLSPAVLSELRLLASTHFDSRLLLTVVLAGDRRLNELLRREELLPLGSRIRARLNLEYASREDLLACLQHLAASAGNPTLMTAELLRTLCDHAMGNYRALTTMAAELLAVAAQRELTQLDEKLYLEVFAPPGQATTKRRERLARS